MPSIRNPLAPYAPAKATDLKQLYSWYREPNQPPFFIEIAGPTPTFTYLEFTTYCQQDSSLWVRRGELGFVLLTYIQRYMRVANLDFNLRNLPEPESQGASELSQGIRAMCAKSKVRKAQLLAIASDVARLNLAESIGMRREGILKDHFYHAGHYHDLVCLGWFDEHAHE